MGNQLSLLLHLVPFHPLKLFGSQRCLKHRVHLRQEALPHRPLIELRVFRHVAKAAKSARCSFAGRLGAFHPDFFPVWAINCTTPSGFFLSSLSQTASSGGTLASPRFIASTTERSHWRTSAKSDRDHRSLCKQRRNSSEVIILAVGAGFYVLEHQFEHLNGFLLLFLRLVAEKLR